MRLILILLISGLFVGCNQVNDKPLPPGSPYEMSCTETGWYGIDRCENKEVICYRDESGLQCKFK